MSIRVGKVEIKATQRVEALETRTLVGMRVPGQAGGVQQNLGREPVLLAVEGILFGGEASKSVESLRAAYATGEPQSFAGDIAVGVEFTDVIVEDLRLVQVSGTLDRYQTSLRLREYTEPPERAGFGLPEVDLSILAELGDWLDVAMTLARIAQDPSKLLDELKNNKLLRDKLGIARVEQLAYEAAGQILGVSPEQVREWAGKAEEYGGDVVDVAQGLADAPDLVPQLERVAKRAERLVTRFAEGSLAKAVSGEGPSAMDLIVGDLKELVKATGELLANKALKVFTHKMARVLGLVDVWNAAVEDACKFFAEIAKAIRDIIPWVTQADALLAAFEILSPAIGGIATGAGAFTGQLSKLGAPVPAGDIQGMLSQVEVGIEKGVAYAKGALPTTKELEELARSFDPDLATAVLGHRVVGR